MRTFHGSIAADISLHPPTLKRLQPFIPFKPSVGQTNSLQRAKRGLDRDSLMRVNTSRKSSVVYVSQEKRRSVLQINNVNTPLLNKGKQRAQKALNRRDEY